MARVVRCGLIQAQNVLGPEAGLPRIKKAMIDKHVSLIAEAARKKVKILCLQELFYGPYFCAEQETRWYDITERVPDGPTVSLMRKLARKHKMVIVVPIYEEDQPGIYYNTAAVIDADGSYLGKYRKTHIPHCKPGFWEKFYFRPGNLGYPTFETAYAKIGVYICYDRHFPEGARALGLAGAEIVFNPSATVALMQKLAKKHKMVIIVPIYEEDQPGVYYNTAAVIDADGRYLGKYRKTHIPHCKPGFWEKFYFRPGNLGYPTFETAHAKIGVYICYDRHFPEGARALGLAGAEIVFNPSATVAGLSEYLWKLEQPAHAVANGYFVGAINRVGNEAPWNIGEFYGQSYFCDPRGKIIAEAPRDKDAVVVADLNLDMITEVRGVWQFFRDRRPDAYGSLVEP